MMACPVAAGRHLRLPALQTHPRLLEKRADFARYYERPRTNPQFLARELAKQTIAVDLEARRFALDEAVRAGDHTAIEQLTRPFVELACRPIRVRRTEAPPIVVHIGYPMVSPRLETSPEDCDVEHEIVQSPDWDD